MTGIFRLWNQDKGRYLKFDCTMSEIQNGRIKLSDNEGAEVLGSFERALDYRHALNLATQHFLYDGTPWHILGADGIIIEGLQFCQKCGQDLTERVCDHIGGKKCPSSGLPLEACGCEECTHHEPKTTTRTEPVENPYKKRYVNALGEPLDGIPEQVKNIAESVVDNLKNLDPRVSGAEAAAAIKRQSADIRKALGTTLADKETVTTNHDDELFDDDKETELPAHLDGMVDDDKETVTTNHEESVADKLSNIHPNHYAQGAGGATFDVIEALYQVLPWEQFKGYMKGNIIKYTVRYDAKNGTEDVEKAAEYNRRLMAYEVREGAKNAS